LEDLFLSFEQAIKQLNEKIKDIEINKEKLKQNIQNIFTKIRNAINEREDQLLLDVDTKFEKFYSEQNIFKKNEKLPNKIKKSLEKGKLINEEWNENNLAEIIYDCTNIENSIEKLSN
jgi:arginyl-tRNA synthetase